VAKEEASDGMKKREGVFSIVPLSDRSLEEGRREKKRDAWKVFDRGVSRFSFIVSLF